MDDITITFLIAGASWYIYHFFGNQILDFINLRKAIQEELIYAANIWDAKYDTDRVIRTYDKIRRLSAQLTALDTSLFPWSRFVLYKLFKVDLKTAAQQLLIYEADIIDVQNTGGIRTQAKHKIEKALCLPFTDTSERIESVVKIKKRELSQLR